MVILHLKSRPINQLPARLKIVIQAELRWYHRGLISSDMETEAPSHGVKTTAYLMYEAPNVSKHNNVLITSKRYLSKKKSVQTCRMYVDWFWVW